MSSWHFYPKDRFSSYEDYVKYLKEKGFAYDAPEGIYKEEKQMKAPEAPDKIYIQPSTIDELPRQNIVYTKQLSNTSIEYICKDALLEWVKGFTEPKIFCSTLIDKINSM